MSEPPEPRLPQPFSWDVVAAELAAAEAADEERAGPGSRRPADNDWDTVATRLAASLDSPAGTPPVRRQKAAAPGTSSTDVPAGTSPGLSEPSRPARRELVDLPTRPLDEAPVEEVDPRPRPPQLVSVPDDVAPADIDLVQLRGGVEALLFVLDSPVDEDTLAATLRCPVPAVHQALVELGETYDSRRAGIVLRRVGAGWRLYTREEHAVVVERYLTDGRRSRLTQAALETLAVIAYRQPVTRARVSAIRGVGVDAVVRTLMSRGLVHECGTDPDSGGGLYATTPLFLERLGLTGLDELPELAPLLPEATTVLDEHPDA